MFRKHCDAETYTTVYEVEYTCGDEHITTKAEVRTYKYVHNYIYGEISLQFCHMLLYNVL